MLDPRQTAINIKGQRALLQACQTDKPAFYFKVRACVCKQSHFFDLHQFFSDSFWFIHKFLLPLSAFPILEQTNILLILKQKV